MISSTASSTGAPAIDDFLDDRCGVVAGIEQVPVRAPWHLIQTRISEPLWRLRPDGGRVAAGCSRDHDRARASALGEAVERYCSMHPDPRRLRRTAHDRLRTSGERSVDPAALVLARAANDAELTDVTECDWVEGHDRHGSCWVPAALAWTEPGPHARTSSGTPYCAPHSQGVALASTMERARHLALGEAVERHSVATAWHLGLAFDELDPDDDIGRWRVPNRWGLPVVLAAIVEPEWIAAGSALAATIDDAADKASAEAVMMSHTLAVAADSDSTWARRRQPDGEADVLDLVAHAAFCRRPAIRRRQLDRLRLGHGGTAPAQPPTAWAAAPGGCGADQLDPERALLASGLEPITVDLTTSDVADAGWCVVRVVVPGLRATAPAGFLPHLGGIDPLAPEPDLTPIPVM